MHPAAFGYVAECWYRLAGELDKCYAVDLGGAQRNADAPHVRDLFTTAKLYTIVDERDELDVDVVADITAPLPWPGLAFDPSEAFRYDVVVCTEVLEHVAGWRSILTNAAALLRHGGVLIVTCAGPERAPHGATDAGRVDGEHYANVDAGELADALRSTGWELVECRAGDHRRDTYALARRGRSG